MAFEAIKSRKEKRKEKPHHRKRSLSPKSLSPFFMISCVSRFSVSAFQQKRSLSPSCPRSRRFHRLSPPPFLFFKNASPPGVPPFLFFQERKPARRPVIFIFSGTRARQASRHFYFFRNASPPGVPPDLKSGVKKCPNLLMLCGFEIRSKGACLSFLVGDYKS